MNDVERSAVYRCPAQSRKETTRWISTPTAGAPCSTPSATPRRLCRNSSPCRTARPVSRLARATLANFKARGPVSRSLPRAAHAGERILADTMGSHGPDDIAKAFESSVRELEARVAAAEHDATRIELRHRQCADRLAALHRLVEACRTWAAEQGVVLPGEDVRIVPPTGLPGPQRPHRRPAARCERLPREAGMNAAIEKLDAEIARLQVEIASVERAPPTIAERFADVRGRAARGRSGSTWRTAIKRRAGHPGETAHLQRQAVHRRLHGGRRRQAPEGRAPAHRGAGRRPERAPTRRAGWTICAARSCAPRRSASCSCARSKAPNSCRGRSHAELAIYKQAAVEQLAR